MNAYEVRRSRTLRRRGKGFGWEVWDKDTQRFPDLVAVRKFLDSEYGRCRRQPMYRDTPTGSERVGTIYCYREGPAVHGDHHKWCQDWVEVYAVTIERLPWRQWRARA